MHTLKANARRRSKRRPFGVTLIATAQAAHALATALSWDLSTISPWDVDGTIPSRAGTRLVIVLLGLAIALGLWWLQRWAWVAAMLWVGANMTAALIAWFNGPAPYPLMALSVLVVFYLNQSDVQRAFRDDDRPGAGSGVGSP